MRRVLKLTLAVLFALTLHFATNTAVADGHPDAKKLLEMIEKQQKELDALKKALVETQAHKPLQVVPAVCRMLFPRTSLRSGYARDRGDEHRVVYCGHEYERFIVSKSNALL